eukprot:9318678-Lingulodinium_polyedra.AAC.1
MPRGRNPLRTKRLADETSADETPRGRKRARTKRLADETDETRADETSADETHPDKMRLCR